MDGLGEGFPEWTELGQDSGLDPLGMQRPIEVIYQSLLPGISTITLRYRYYSFFSMILKHYEVQKRDTDPEKFRSYHRRCEALLALISCFGNSELGITGSDWATSILNNALAQNNGTTHIDFSIGADQNSQEGLRYLKNKAGAFGAIYSTQMSEMGLLHFAHPDQQNPNPVCSDIALKLADSMTHELGSFASEFFETVEAGTVCKEKLEDFGVMKPSNLKLGSTEHLLLVDIFLGKTGTPSLEDTMRRNTLLLVLEFACSTKSLPAADKLKWHWFETVDQPSQNTDPHISQLWFLYQACDLMRLAYETILHAALTVIQSSPRKRMSLFELANALADYVEDETDKSWEHFSNLLNNNADVSEAHRTTLAMRDSLNVGEVANQVRHAISLVAILAHRASKFVDLMEKALNGAEHFQSLRTEWQYLERHRKRNARELIIEVIRDRVIKRHLWVASRKFRNQKAYTFLIEPEDQLLRYRDTFRVSPSSPRLDQAIRFLKDIYLIKDDGVTEIGRAELVAT